MAHHFLAHSLAQSADQIPQFQKFFAEQARGVGSTLFISAEPMARHAILSAPDLYNTWADKGRYISRIHKVFGADDTEIVIVLRQPQQLAESIYKELIRKSNASISFERFLATRFYGYNFPKLVTSWQNYFNKVTVRIFEDDRKHPEGTIGAILRPICPDMPRIPKQEILSSGLDPQYVAFKRMINTGRFSNGDIAKILDALSQLNDIHPRNDRSTFWTEQLLALFQRRAEVWSDAIGAGFFLGQNQLFPPFTMGDLNSFYGLTASEFAQILDQISETLPYRLVEKIVNHLATQLQ
ncbi:MAG: hypothetical protein JKY31_07510 [Rhodobacteraceae bacterium]|nr:hypothetical protein [Paracoccaceae bacterium]